MKKIFKAVRAEMRHLDKINEIEKESFSDPWSREALASSMESDVCIFVVAEDDNGEVAGYAAADCAADEGEILNIAVDRRFRRCGAGEFLLSDMLRRLAERGAFRVYLEVRESNFAARSLYEKAGFESIGIRKKYYRVPCEDAVVMAKDIK